MVTGLKWKFSPQHIPAVSSIVSSYWAPSSIGHCNWPCWHMDYVLGASAHIACSIWKDSRTRHGKLSQNIWRSGPSVLDFNVHVFPWQVFASSSVIAVTDFISLLLFKALLCICLCAYYSVDICYQAWVGTNHHNIGLSTRASMANDDFWPEYSNHLWGWERHQEPPLLNRDCQKDAKSHRPQAIHTPLCLWRDSYPILSTQTSIGWWGFNLYLCCGYLVWGQYVWQTTQGWICPITYASSGT